MPVKFEKRLIADERYESAGIFDVDGDGVLDIVSGAYWYKGPGFTDRFRTWDVPAYDDYFDDFSTIALDVNGNGHLDFITGGWWGQTIRWIENPSLPDASWPVHEIAKVGCIESTRAWDIDGDGVIEIVPNTPGDPLIAYKLVTDAAGQGTGAFEAHTLWQGPQGHGIGFGDITGSGRGDFVFAHGWLESPEHPWSDEWTWHPEFDLGSASVPILVADVTNNGINDLIVGQSHNYGLHWWEQRIDNGQRSWVRHPIDPYNSQYHDLLWIDVDNDGQCELVTGKRYLAHCGRDPGAYDPIGIYYFKWTGESFSKQVIDFGPARVGTGVGIHFAMADLTGNGLPDLVAPGKDGLYLFVNHGG